VMWNIGLGELRGASESKAKRRIPSLPSCYSECYHYTLTERNEEYCHNLSQNNRTGRPRNIPNKEREVDSQKYKPIHSGICHIHEDLGNSKIVRFVYFLLMVNPKTSCGIHIKES